MPSIALRPQAVVCAVILAALAALPRVGAQNLPPELLPAFQIPRVSQAPTIDGVMADGEWENAVGIGGTVDVHTRNLVGRPDAFYLSWDPGHLYIAAKIWMDGSYIKPHIRDGRDQGLAYVFDDGLEINLMPLGKNVKVGATPSSYKWFLNALGYGGDYSRNSVGQQFKNWTPDFEVATSMTAPGTAPNGGRWCIIEMAATPGDFELTGDHRAGDEWRMLLSINHFMGRWSQAPLPMNGPYLNSDGHCRAVLVENAPAIQTELTDLQNLATGGAFRRDVRIHNPTAKAQTMTLSYGIVDSEVSGEQTLDIPAGETVATQIDAALPAELAEGTAYLTVDQGKTRLYTYGAHFKVGKAVETFGVRGQPKGDFPLQVRFNPVRGNLLVKADTYYLPETAEPTALHYRVSREGDEQAVAEGEITGISLWYIQELIQLPELQAGSYDVSVSMQMADGGALGPISSSFEKKDEAAAFPDWWANDLDDIRRVIPPFTAMTREDQTVGVWGRDYALGALGLPRQIQSQGEAVMAAPARIVATIGGEQLTLDVGADGNGLQFTQTTDYRVAFTGQASLGGIALSVDGWLEQDGLCYLQLTYQNADADTPLTVDDLRLEFPLAGSDADTLYCVGPGENYSSRTTRILPPEQQGQLWSTHDTGAKASQMSIGSFYPQVWIGSERRGFLWWGDNDRGWVPSDAHPAHSAERRGDAVVLVNHLISEPFELAAPRTVTFSYNASPFRPLVRGWRHFITTQDGTFFQPHRKTRKDSKTGKPVNTGHGHINWIHPESRYPEEWDALWAEQKEKADRRVLGNRARDPYDARSGIHFGHISFQIMRYGRKSAEAELYQYFGEEWESVCETWNPSFRRYCLSLFERGFRDGGYYTTYWDLQFPILFRGLQSGLAYRLPDGRVQPGYNGFNLRRFYMGLYALAEENGLAPGAIGVHSTNSYILVAMPWNDAVLDGEYGFLRDGAERDWVDQFPIERMRTLSVSHNWGSTVCWMELIKFTDKEKLRATTRAAVEYIWLYDSWRNPYMEPFTKMPEAALDWGLTDPDVAYHPFWRNPHVTVTGGGDDILVSAWQWDDRIMLNVYNYNRKQQKNAEVTIDLDALGLRPELVWQEAVQARDLYKDDDAPKVQFNTETGKITIKNLPPHRGRLIGIRRY